MSRKRKSGQGGLHTPHQVNPPKSEGIETALAKAREYFALGKHEQSFRVYQSLLAEYPVNADIYLELGAICWRLGLSEKAESAYRSAVKLRPSSADAHCNLGVVVWQRDGLSAALPHLQKAIQLDPGHSNAIYNLAGMLAQAGCCKEAIYWFDKILLDNPRHADAWMYKGNAHYERGETEFALECYRKVDELKPTGGSKIRIAAAVPMIPQSVEHIRRIRRRFLSQIQQLIDARITVEDPVCENGYTNFFLAYHGMDDLPSQRKYAELYEQACPSLLYEASHCGGKIKLSKNRRIRVAFISKYFKGHSIGKTSFGVIKYLDRKQFEVVVIFLGPPVDPMGRAIAAVADEVLVLSNDLHSARQMIEGKRLDILFYQDIGMDPFTYFLAFSRLAPVQCASFGHPVTSGIVNIDYHISTELWEPEDADRHYSETLIRLQGVASVAYYYKPELPRKMQSRSYFNLPEDAHLYICPQTLFKFHPEFDFIMADILRGDSDGIIVLIEGIHDSWSEILRRRFGHAIQDVADRIHFVPRQSGENYMSLLGVADVMLDTIHFCGFNTTLEGFSAGLPVVTLPGKYMRSRHTAAFYRKIGFTECIASDTDHYVEIALRLGTDATFRSSVLKEIYSRMDILWEEVNVIHEFERFFANAHHAVLERSYQ